MAKLINKLSVFLPTFNEAGSIKDVVLKVKTVLNEVSGEWEIVVVNDGSFDKTKEIVSAISQKDPRVRVISHSANRGYGAAFKTGFYSCKYPWISFIDSDGQFDFSEIKNFLIKQKETGADIVIGYYKKRRVSLSKILTSRLWELFVFILFGLKVRDIDCGFKLVNKKVIETIPKLESERGAFISSEFLVKARKAGFKMVEIPVTHYPRLKGEGTGRKINVIIQSFIDLFKLWKKLR